MYRWSIEFDSLDEARKYYCAHGAVCTNCIFSDMVVRHIDECESCNTVAERFLEEAEDLLIAQKGWEKIEEVKLDERIH